MATNAQPIQTPPPDPTETQTPDTSADESAVAGSGVNLQKAYSKLNSSIAGMFDGLGVRRAATIKHVAGQSMSDHLTDVGKVLPSIGGVTANFLSATHTQHDPEGGSTIAHPAQKLRSTVIPKDNEAAKSAVSATKSFVTKTASLLGDDDPTVKTAKAQLDLVGKNGMAGMSAFDAGVALLSVPSPLIQKIARLHSNVKNGGQTHAKLTAPSAPAPSGQANAGPASPEDQSQVSTAQTAPETPAQAPVGDSGTPPAENAA